MARAFFLHAKQMHSELGPDDALVFRCVNCLRDAAGDCCGAFAVGGDVAVYAAEEEDRAGEFCEPDEWAGEPDLVGQGYCGVGAASLLAIAEKQAHLEE